MSGIASSTSRVSTQMSSYQMLNNLQRTNVELLRVQQAISSGKQVNLPSDAPQTVSILTQLTHELERMEQQSINLTRAEATTNVTDQALSDISDLILEAENIAQSQIGPLSDATTREAQSEVIAAMIEALREMSTRQHNGVYLFSGQSTDVKPFEDALNGIRYVGATENMTADLGERVPIEINTNGQEALGALSTRVEGSVDLNPNATADTRIAQVEGARQTGITLGTIQIDVNGTISTLNLTGADTLQSVADLINNEIITIKTPGRCLVYSRNCYNITHRSIYLIQCFLKIF